jgi:hypothetical protein
VNAQAILLRIIGVYRPWTNHHRRFVGIELIDIVVSHVGID